jgi:hypothetical protein
MATDTTALPAFGPTIPVENFPENIRPIATDLNAFLREVPRLLAEGEEGRHALIDSGKLLSTWDTYSHALQAGYEKFGADGLFIVQKIDQEQYERFMTLLPAAQHPSRRGRDERPPSE